MAPGCRMGEAATRGGFFMHKTTRCTRAHDGSWVAASCSDSAEDASASCCVAILKSFCLGQQQARVVYPLSSPGTCNLGFCWTTFYGYGRLARANPSLSPPVPWALAQVADFESYPPLHTVHGFLVNAVLATSGGDSACPKGRRPGLSGLRTRTSSAQACPIRSKSVQ